MFLIIAKKVQKKLKLNSETQNASDISKPFINVSNVNKSNVTPGAKKKEIKNSKISLKNLVDFAKRKIIQVNIALNSIPRRLDGKFLKIKQRTRLFVIYVHCGSTLIKIVIKIYYVNVAKVRHMLL